MYDTHERFASHSFVPLCPLCEFNLRLDYTIFDQIGVDSDAKIK